MITIDRHKVTIYHYQKILLVSEDKMSFDLKEKKLTLLGKQLHIVAMDRNEIVIEGQLNSLDFIYENRY